MDKKKKIDVSVQYTQPNSGENTKVSKKNEENLMNAQIH